MLKEFERTKGRTPQALLDKPPLPWYYNDIFNTFTLLSNQRGHYVITTYKVIKNQIVPYSKLVPKPLDTNSILFLAQTTGIMKPKDFLHIVSDLDSMYLKRATEKNG